MARFSRFSAKRKLGLGPPPAAPDSGEHDAAESGAVPPIASDALEGVEGGATVLDTPPETTVTADLGEETVPLRVFINYRRGDSSGYAGRLYDALADRSPNWQVFMDIDTIEPGTDFVTVIDQALNNCDVVIAVIGDQWIAAADAKGQRRLDDPNDFVRLELAAALERDVRVIPALVQGTEMPSASEFPDVLAPLARRHAHELSDGRWRYDIDRLAQILEHIEAQGAEERAARTAEHKRLEREHIKQQAQAIAAQEAAEGEAQEAAERAAAERAAAEQEAAEREAREAVARTVAAREAAEREAQEAAERAAAERAAAEQEAAERDVAERERSKREVEEESRARPKASAIPTGVEQSGAVTRGTGRKRAIVFGSLAALALVGGGVAAVLALSSSSSSTSTRKALEPSPKPAIRLTGVRTNVPVPVPGQPFDAQATAVVAATGEPVSDPKVSCRARLGSKILRATNDQRGRVSHCRWSIPLSAAGATFAGAITVTSKGVSKRHVLRARVGPEPETLVITHPTTPAPVAGDEVTTTFDVHWTRKSGKSRAIDPGSTRGSCRWSIPGVKAFRTTAQISREGITCRGSIPSESSGKTLSILLTVQAKGKTASRTVSAPIAAPAPAPQPTPTPSPTPSPTPAPTPSPPSTVPSPIPGP